MSTYQEETPPLARRSVLWSLRGASPPRKHPRLRGDRQTPMRWLRLPSETPPLARGSGRLTSPGIPPFGNTPACAGIGFHESLLSNRFRKHPRLRGDRCSRQARLTAARETPPLARGSGSDSLKLPLDFGNTPACAGIGLILRLFLGLCQKHPRLRGDRVPQSEGHQRHPETPPLARGSVPLFPARTAQRGNTPACAGIGQKRPCSRAGARKHPRLRGDRCMMTMIAESLLETPPLARGSDEAQSGAGT